LLKLAISVLAPINTLLIFVVGFVGAYQEKKFTGEWIEDHAKSKGLLSRQMLSVTALFSVSLSERCRRRRRQVLLWTAIFFVLLVVQVLLLWLRSL
jgi:cell division protein FtsW (lipid II flippase)